MMPSSDQMASDSSPNSSRMRADRASAQAECTRPPKGDSTHRRQSPISSRKRSITIVRSLGTTRVASRCSRRKADRLRGGALVEVVLGGQLLRLAVHGLAGERADGAAELLRAAHAVAAPERHGARRARRGGHDHAVAGDLLDPPGGRAEQEGLPGAGLVDHLLVQLADPAPVGQVDAVEAAVGDRAGVGHRELQRAAAGADGVLHAVPDDARPQLGELLGGVAAVEHVEHAVEQLARQLGERVGAPHGLVERRHLQLVAAGGHRDDLLGEHVERVARHDRRLDVAVAHALRHHGALEQVGAELREDAPARDLADAVAGAADPLEARGHRLRRLHLDHQVHGAHVDAELERRGGHEAGQLARLEQVLDDQALLARERAVVGAGDVGRGCAVAVRGGAVPLGLLLRRQLVQPHGQPLGAAAVVHEDDRGAVLLHQSQQLRVDRRPDRARRGRGREAARGPSPTRSPPPAAVPMPPTRGVGHVVGVRLAHALHRHVDLEVERLADSGVDHRALAARAHEEAADLLERALRGRQPDALERPPGQLLQPLQA